MPLQMSSLTKTPTYGALTFTSDQATVSHCGVSGIGMGSTAAANNDNDNGQPASKLCIYRHNMKTHYSSSTGSPALSGSSSSIECEGSLSTRQRMGAGSKPKAQIQSSISMDNSLSTVLERHAERERVVRRYARNAPIKICQTAVSKEEEEESKHKPEEVARDETPSRIYRTEFDDLYAKKSELFGTFSTRYDLSPGTLNKFFEVASMEDRFLKRIRRKAETVLKHGKRRSPAADRNRTDDMGDDNKPQPAVAFARLIANFVQRLAERGSALGAEFAPGTDSLGERIAALIMAQQQENDDCGEKEQNELSAMLDQVLEHTEKRQESLERREAAVLRRERVAKSREEDLQRKGEKLLERQEEWAEYERKQRDGLRREEQQLRQDWEKLKLLEDEAARHAVDSERTKAMAKPVPKSACKENRRSRQISVCQTARKRKVGTRKSLEIFSARNRDNVQYTERTEKFLPL